MEIQDINIKLAGLSHEGHHFDSEMLPGDVPVLQVVVDSYAELPIYISASETQIICITYLWSESEVNPDKRSEMLEAMLKLNIPMPLSSFSKIDDRYVIFGALSVNSRLDDITYELTNLCENAVETLSAFEDYLQ